MSTQQPGRRSWGAELRTPITLLVLLGMLFSGLYFGWRGLTAEIPQTTEATPTPSAACTTQQVERGERLRAKQVRVSVFNAGGITGLADETLRALRRRGFRPGDSANAPDDSGVRGVQVWDAQPDSPQAKLVARQFEGPVRRVRMRADLGPGVDVVVGDSFAGFAEKAPRSIKVRTATTICTTTSPGSPGRG